MIAWTVMMTGYGFGHAFSRDPITVLGASGGPNTPAAGVPGFATLFSLLLCATEQARQALEHSGDLLVPIVLCVVAATVVTGHHTGSDMAIFYVDGVSTGVAYPSAVAIFLAAIGLACQSRHNTYQRQRGVGPKD
jgi:hypothetical protein